MAEGFLHPDQMNIYLEQQQVSSVISDLIRVFLWLSSKVPVVFSSAHSPVKTNCTLLHSHRFIYLFYRLLLSTYYVLSTRCFTGHWIENNICLRLSEFSALYMSGCSPPTHRPGASQRGVHDILMSVILASSITSHNCQINTRQEGKVPESVADGLKLFWPHLWFADRMTLSRGLATICLKYQPIVLNVPGWCRIFLLIGRLVLGTAMGKWYGSEVKHL